MKKIMLFMMMAWGTLVLAGCWGNKDKGSDLDNLTIQWWEQNPNQNTWNDSYKSQKETSIKLQNVTDNTISLKEIWYELRDNKISFLVTWDLQGSFEKIDIAWIPIKDNFEIVDFAPRAPSFVVRINLSQDDFVDNKIPLVFQAINDANGKAEVRQQAVYIFLDK